MARLYRKGEIVDFGSSWFPTIKEAEIYETERKEDENIMSIMWIMRELFNAPFEANGVGYRAKSAEDYALANPTIETMTIDEFMERLEHPMISKLYWDGEYVL
ncbi:hypothetical protein J4463_00450 [Candidatus Pacearchaeota archaeon]|nr:hypothetical protein [Candidatus Pacearchaeota archaeon]